MIFIRKTFPKIVWMVTHIVWIDYIFLGPETRGRSLQIREEEEKEEEEMEEFTDQREEDIEINLNINVNRED